MYDGYQQPYCEHPMFPEYIREHLTHRKRQRMSFTDGMAKDAEIKRSQPMFEVPATEIEIASGAARAAFAVSSDMWAAESSWYAILSSQTANKFNNATYSLSVSTSVM